MVVFFIHFEMYMIGPPVLLGNQLQASIRSEFMKRMLRRIHSRWNVIHGWVTRSEIQKRADSPSRRRGEGPGKRKPFKLT